VFEPDTRFLIDAVYNLFRGRKVSKRLLKRNTKRHYSKLMELLQKFGVEDDGYYIKLKGVEREE
jgi:hypothetical protein